MKGVLLTFLYICIALAVGFFVAPRLKLRG